MVFPEQTHSGLCEQGFAYRHIINLMANNNYLYLSLSLSLQQEFLQFSMTNCLIGYGWAYVIVRQALNSRLKDGIH